MRRFELVRNEDVSGVSGTGVVAEGVEFWDGTVSMRWRAPFARASTGFYSDVEHVEEIHGHEGATKVRFIDTE